ncbi:MAG: glutamyl-tRNA reductase [Bacteroidota bacterium]
MNLLSIGISHHNASVALRERMWLSDAEIREALPRLRQEFFSECVLISTCNRTELYGMTANPEVREDAVKEFLIGLKTAGDIVGPEHLTARVGADAVEQIFRVASGIDSMIVGDIQILNQVKVAYAIARETDALGPVTNRLMQFSLHVGKRARSETSICEGAVSVSYAAVELAGKIFADLAKKSALLVGAGETGELTLKHLSAKGIGEVKIANRTREKAEALVADLGGLVVDYDEIVRTLPSVDIVITSVNSPTHILGRAEIQRIMKQRSNDPLFIIDIGVPRNVEPASNRIDNVFLYDIDSLSAIVDKNLGRRKTEMPKVNQIIQEEIAALFDWYNALQVGPTIEEFRNTIEDIRREEVEKNINRFSFADRDLVELVTRRIVNKILHQPMTALKKSAQNGAGNRETLQRVETLRELFGMRGRKGEDHDG